MFSYLSSSSFEKRRMSSRGVAFLETVPHAQHLFLSFILYRFSFQFYAAQDVEGFTDVSVNITVAFFRSISFVSILDISV
jgi:hypothetical protein